MRRDDVPGDRPEPIGGTCVDFTAKRADGTAVRVLLVDTPADGVTPTARDRSAAARIGAARPHDELRLVPQARDTAEPVEGTTSLLGRVIGWIWRSMMTRTPGR